MTGKNRGRNRYYCDAGETLDRRRLASYNDELAEVIEKEAETLYAETYKPKPGQTAKVLRWEDDTSKARMGFRMIVVLGRITEALSEPILRRKKNA